MDAVVVAAECVNALQSIRSRRIDTMEPLVITVGSIHGGNRFNIIADEVKLEGTVRTLNEDVRKHAQEMQYEEGAAVTYNDPQLVSETLPTLERITGAQNLLNPKPQMGAEDFSYYQRVVPGFFYFLGVANKQKGITAMVHTPEFDLDEDALVIGVKAMSNVLLDYLDRHAGDKK
ncbi:MAG: hypothetical protein DMF65_11745 [Acidobacteria bacterium]|nr:MAG: hypothetical protein DMF65_11745 [Acidobacteriota bacterium]